MLQINRHEVLVCVRVYFYFQMLKDKKKIHKTNGNKNIHDRKELLKKAPRIDPPPSHFVYSCICSCYCVICKTLQMVFPQTDSWLDTSTALQALQPDEASSVADKHHFHTFESKLSKLKRPLFSLTPFAPWDEDSRTTHTLVAKNPPPPSLPSVQRDWMWIIQNWFLSTLNDNCSYRHKNTKVLFNIYIFSPQVVSKRVSPQRALRNEVPCADRYQCMPSLYSWKMHMSNSVAFPVQQVSKIFYKQIKCSNIYP